MNRQMDEQTDGWMGGQPDKDRQTWAVRQIDGQTDEWADDEWTDR